MCTRIVTIFFLSKYVLACSHISYGMSYSVTDLTMWNNIELISTVVR